MKDEGGKVRVYRLWFLHPSSLILHPYSPRSETWLS
jgi:hypothetical protein